MKKWIVLGLACLSTAALADSTVWHGHFFGTIPNAKGVSKQFCYAHSPTGFKTTVKNILTNGAKSGHGLIIKYHNYKQHHKGGLYFIDVNATLSGKTKEGKAWSTPMTIHEQTLTKRGATYCVWRTNKCKGFFVGRPGK